MITESNKEIESKFTYLMRWMGLHILHDLITVWNTSWGSYGHIRCTARTVFLFFILKRQNKKSKLCIKVVLNSSSNKTVFIVVREILCTISACQTLLILLTNKYYSNLWQWMSCLFRHSLLLRDNESPACFDAMCPSDWATTLVWEYMLLAIFQNFPYLK